MMMRCVTQSGKAEDVRAELEVEEEKLLHPDEDVSWSSVLL